MISTDSQAIPSPPRTGPGSPRIVPSEAILAGEREVCIAHGAEIYRLRVTSTGKLILTK